MHDFRPSTVTPSLPPAEVVLAAAERAMGAPEARARIETVSATALCHGPRGAYETRLVSDRRGNLSFLQLFPDRRNIAGVRDGRGWCLNEEGREEPIDRIETSLLHDHEFPLLALDLAKRFRGFKTVGSRTVGGIPTLHVTMVDELGNPAQAHFSATTHLLTEVTRVNVRSRNPPTATVRFDRWRRVAEVRLVDHVSILLGKELWTFEFTSLSANAARIDEVGAPVGSRP